VTIPEEDDRDGDDDDDGDGGASRGGVRRALGHDDDGNPSAAAALAGDGPASPGLRGDGVPPAAAALLRRALGDEFLYLADSPEALALVHFMAAARGELEARLVAAVADAEGWVQAALTRRAERKASEAQAARAQL
jgi:hypothetical protein